LPGQLKSRIQTISAAVIWVAWDYPPCCTARVTWCWAAQSNSTWKAAPRISTQISAISLSSLVKRRRKSQRRRRKL